MKDITLDMLLRNRNSLLDQPIIPHSNQVINSKDDLFHKTKIDFDPFQMKGIRALLE